MRPPGRCSDCSPKAPAPTSRSHWTSRPFAKSSTACRPDEGHHQRPAGTGHGPDPRHRFPRRHGPRGRRPRAQPRAAASAPSPRPACRRSTPPETRRRWSALYLQVQPDLVMLDLHMPGMDGIAVMQALAEATPNEECVPVIVLTADATTQARDRVLAAGANDFLTKPVDRTEVVLRVRNLLHSRSLHVRLQEHNGRLQDGDRGAARSRGAGPRHDDRQGAARAGRLDAGAPRMVFQPIADLSSGAVVGYEALARFDERAPPSPGRLVRGGRRGRTRDRARARRGRAPRSSTSSRSRADAFLTPQRLAGHRLHAPARRPARRSPGARLVLEITEHVRVDDYGLLLDAPRPAAPARACGWRWTTPAPASPASTTSSSSAPTSSSSTSPSPATSTATRSSGRWRHRS